MGDLHLTSAPSRAGWDRDAETAAMMAWNGSIPLLDHLENARREGTREWDPCGINMPGRGEPEDKIGVRGRKVYWRKRLPVVDTPAELAIA